MHPFILPHAMGGCVKHRVKRGLMFRRAASTSLSRALGAAGNSSRFVFAFRFKRGLLGALQMIFGTSEGGSASYLCYSAGDQLQLTIEGNDLRTNAVFRDPNAFDEFIVSCDLANGTAANRAWILHNGVQLTSFAADGRGSWPAACDFFNNAYTHYIGRGSTADHYLDGVMAEVIVLSGVSLQSGEVTAADFGFTDNKSGARAPKKFLPAIVGQGGYYPFIGDAGDAPATATEGVKDRSGLGNNWTPSNFAASDFVKDTPANYATGADYRGNFSTLNPIDRRVGVGTMSDSNLKLAATTINPHRTRSTIAIPSTGKRIFSVELVVGGSLNMTGLMRADLSTNDASPNLGLRSGEVSYIASSGEVYKENALQGTYATITTVGHHAVWVIDPAGNRAWIGKWDGANLVWFGGGDPAAGTLPTLSSLPAGKLFPCIAPDTGVTLKAWFGAQGFPFAVPAGVKPLVVSALPKSSIIKPSQAFVQAVDSGANIVANLTAKRSGWGAAYVEIIKSVAAEGWRIRFGSDAGFYYDSSNAAAGRQAYPALPGASYWGCSLRIGAQYGVAAGSVVHVNGVASVVADGLNTVRKAVILFPRAGGNMPVYHPEANAGELLYLNLTNGDAPATDITAVTSSGFSIGAGMASGTYDWLVLAETSGLIALTKNVGTGQADGPFIHTGMAPGMIIDKRIDAADGWYLFDAARNTYNPRDRQLRLETNIAEVPGTTFGDFLANGAKVRTTAVGFNASGGSYVQISIAAAAFANGECAAQGTAN